MNTKILGLAAISVLLTAAIVMALDSHPFAEAKPASMSPKHKYSYWTSHVCGDKLCDDKDYSRTSQYIGKSRTR